ncbi:MAG: DUF2431 domain-containing protein [Gammaproteobacteria bacterium]|nr:DUF2431 domain-containing protein [Gammaproteobacteria bacterium]
MIIDPNWRILTVGDGDFSFSASLLQHHQPTHLTAAILDSYQTLNEKYGDKFYQQLIQGGAEVLTEFDVTDRQCFSRLGDQKFDLVIFQFPLIPGFSSQQHFADKCQHIGVNTLNRRLLRSFLQHCFKYGLDLQGAQLCVITSKDVKPYRQWNIEHSLTIDTDIHYLGSMPFNASDFPNYQVRNVDRDKFVKDTLGISYFWSQNPHHQLTEKLKPLAFQGEDSCAMCRVGPFMNQQDKLIHQQSKRHTSMAQFEQQWLNDLSNHSSV